MWWLRMHRLILYILVADVLLVVLPARILLVLPEIVLMKGEEIEKQCTSNILEWIGDPP